MPQLMHCLDSTALSHRRHSDGLDGSVGEDASVLLLLR